MRPSAVVVVILCFAAAWNTAAQGPSPEQQSDHEITFLYDRHTDKFEVDVFDEAGKFAAERDPATITDASISEELSRTWTPEQLFKSGLLAASLVFIEVKSGGTVKETFEVSKYYDMTTPGVYKVEYRAETRKPEVS